MRRDSLFPLCPSLSAPTTPSQGNTMNKTLLCVAINSAMIFTAQAYDQIPAAAGFSGALTLAVDSSSSKSNMAGDEVIDSLNSSSKSDGGNEFGPGLELSYTFIGSRTQLFAGTERGDRGDLGVGIRQGVGSLGNLRASLLRPGGGEVWQDPYAVGVERDDTETSGTGMILGWEHIFESDFDITYSQRSIELDDERSGTALGLTPGQRALLNREGDEKTLAASYHWMPSSDHLIIPTLSHVNQDLDGGAMAMDGIQFDLSYAYLGMQGWELGAHLTSSSLKSDDINPIFAKKQDLDSYALGLQATYLRPFNLPNWELSAGLHYSKDNSNIKFYEGESQGVDVAMTYTF
jgi:hypothetical protein